MTYKQLHKFNTYPLELVAQRIANVFHREPFVVRFAEWPSKVLKLQKIAVSH